MNHLNKIITVQPILEYAKRKNLFSALEHAFQVKFVPHDIEHIETCDASIYVCLNTLKAEHIYKPSLIILQSDYSFNHERAGFIKFTGSIKLDDRLRNKMLNDFDYDWLTALEKRQRDYILAESRNQPVWIKRIINGFPADIISGNIKELERGLSLRNYTYKYGIFSLIPIIHFLREITHEYSYVKPGLRAAFIIDDANIRFLSYGHIKYKELVQKAKQNKFHVSLASIPLDLKWSSKRSVDLMKANLEYFSLSIHGNFHNDNEMFKEYTDGEEYQLISSILDRVRKFKNKNDVPVSRVLIPPYGRISPQLLRALSNFEFDAVCVSSQFRYLEQDTSVPRYPELAEWYPSDFLFGMHVIPRRFPPLSKSEILLAAFLDHPIIIRYHPVQLIKGYDNMIRKARFINSLGKVEWISAGAIAESNFFCRTENDSIRIRAFSNRICIDIPSLINELIIEIPDGYGLSEIESVIVNGESFPLARTAFGKETSPIPLEHKGRNTFTINFFAKEDHSVIVPLESKVSDYLKRRFSEVRDRSRKYVDKLK